jgi:hypothetical protein
MAICVGLAADPASTLVAPALFRLSAITMAAAGHAASRVHEVDLQDAAAVNLAMLKIAQVHQCGRTVAPVKCGAAPGGAPPTSRRGAPCAATHVNAGSR